MHKAQLWIAYETNKNKMKLNKENYHSNVCRIIFRNSYKMCWCSLLMIFSSHRLLPISMKINLLNWDKVNQVISIRTSWRIYLHPLTRLNFPLMSDNFLQFISQVQHFGCHPNSMPEWINSDFCLSANNAIPVAVRLTSGGSLKKRLAFCSLCSPCHALNDKWIFLPHTAISIPSASCMQFCGIQNYEDFPGKFHQLWNNF